MGKVKKMIEWSLKNNSRVIELCSYDAPPYFSFRTTNDNPYSEECVFDVLPEDQIISLLHFFCSEKWETGFSWDLNVEFAKLLAKKGALIKSHATKFFMRHYKNGTCFSDACFLQLSYLGSSTEFEDRCIELLQNSVEDSRDGIFIAAFRLNTPRVRRCMEECFLRWKEDFSWGEGTGELLALRHYENGKNNF